MGTDDEAACGAPHWQQTNLVGLPTPLLASIAFNAHPQPLHIGGARESAVGLFALLDRCGSADEAREVFAHYMKLAFGLAKPQPRVVANAAQADAAPACAAEQRRWRTSYLKLLQGWGMDANGAAGAVLKSWVESRFGLVPTFHKSALARYPSPAWIAYLEEKTSSRYHSNNVFQQLDLLYEFCQWMLARFQLLGPAPRLTMWRGSTRCEEQITAGSLRRRRCTMRLNNLVSFSLSPAEAGCFGDWVLQAQVPLCKVLFLPGLVDRKLLQGEAEVLAIGGDYSMRASYAD
ncbi:MAG: NAD(+)--dinitrogen-reductase ADP-D-ribosyltransferase [Burkholderiales bacterium]|nr:NAD(+)--dinitrogen-reductase ADP-D-ribosyltransferase [Burkholderiales bacterium]